MKSLKLASAKKKSLDSALTAIEVYAASALDVWPSLTPPQRDALVAHSPVLARIIDLSRRMEATWQR